MTAADSRSESSDGPRLPATHRLTNEPRLQPHLSFHSHYISPGSLANSENDIRRGWTSADLLARTSFAFAFFNPFPLHQIWSGTSQTKAAFGFGSRAGVLEKRRTQAPEASSLMGRDKHDCGEKHTSLVGLNTRSQRESLRLNGISKAHQSLLPGTAAANTPKSDYDTSATSAAPERSHIAARNATGFDIPMVWSHIQYNVGSTCFAARCEKFFNFVLSSEVGKITFFFCSATI